MLDMMTAPCTVRTFQPDTIPFSTKAWTVAVVRANGANMMCNEHEIGEIWLQAPTLKRRCGRLLKPDTTLFDGWITVHGWTGVRQEGPFFRSGRNGVIRDGQIVCLDGSLMQLVNDLKVRVVEGQSSRLAATNLRAG